jgi:hypothetical protein
MVEPHSFKTSCEKDGSVTLVPVFQVSRLEVTEQEWLQELATEFRSSGLLSSSDSDQVTVTKNLMSVCTNNEIVSLDTNRHQLEIILSLLLNTILLLCVNSP